MTCETPCKNCDRKGLPILFTRYAAAYSAREDGMQVLKELQAVGKFQSAPEGVTLNTALYNVRMLRTGYLYIHVDRGGMCSDDEWKGYAVHPHGYLSEFEVMLPETAQAHIACARDSRQANNSMVWVSNAKQVRKLWYMFHPDPIDPTHLFKEIVPNIAKYMQGFDVAAWVNGSVFQPDTCQPGQLNAQIMEFAALKSTMVQKVGVEQYFGLMGASPQERAWGDFEEQRHGRHFETEAHETRQSDGTFKREPATGAASGLMMGDYVVKVKQVNYKAAHGERLDQIREFLSKNNGAVLACSDPIGIAQELSQHHLTASIPYIDWLKETDEKGQSNQWKQAASESIRTIRSALAKKTIQAYDDETDSIKDRADNITAYYPGSDSNQLVKWRNSDGSYEEISVQELNRRRREELEPKIKVRDSDRVPASEAASKSALEKTDALCDVKSLLAFDKLHTEKIKERDDLMDKIAEDLQAWLKAEALIEKALGRYSDRPGMEGSDGANCAGQLCAILLQIDSAPKGRQWYAALDTFTPDKKNLVWRMLSLNNADISKELQAALAPLTGALPPASADVKNAEDNASDQKSYTALVTALTKMSKALSAADKLNKEFTTVRDKNAKTSARIQAALQISKTMKDSPHAVLTAAVLARVKELPANKAEILIAKAQALLLAQGLGKQAIAFAKKQEMEALSKQAAKQARYTQRGIEKAIRGQISTVAGKDMRLPTVLLSLNTLALLAALGKAHAKADDRTTIELLGTMASVIGSLRQWRADLYEKAIYKQVPDLVYKTHKAGMKAATESELLGMKAGAARFVVAGAAVVVVWDAVDAVTGFREGEYILSVNYAMRALTGLFTIASTIRAASVLETSIWLTRANFYTAAVTVVLTFAIEKIKGEAWANWLQAQVFRSVKSQKIPYKSEEETMQKLAVALADMK